MTVAELIDNLSTLPKSLEVTTYNSEWSVQERLTRLSVKKNWEGTSYLALYFDGEFDVEQPPPEPPKYLYRCSYCGREEKLTEPKSCDCVSWRPMMNLVQQQEV